jgi:DNA-binding SARP family transcriptional activator
MTRYAILGPVELRDGERTVLPGGPRQVVLLAVLLVNANRAVSVDQLINALWGDLGTPGALRRLRVAITRLRRMLDAVGAQDESVLRTVAGGYLLAVGRDELDADVFGRRMEEGRGALARGEVARARDALDQALGMWRGPVLADVSYEAFAQPEIRRLEELRLTALEARADCELRLGEHGRLVAELEALVAAHPGRERLTAQLMLALYRCGRQGEALERYARTRAYLSSELGLEPGPALQALQADVLVQAPALRQGPGEPRAAEVIDAPTAQYAGAAEPALVGDPLRPALPRSLRTPTGSVFVGREAELACLRAHWMQVQGGARSAVVIGGEAGIGKTRLVSELARTAHREDARVLYGRCDQGLAVPYQPFVEAIRSLLSTVDADELRRRLGGLAPELGRLLPELGTWGSPAPADPESARFALFAAVASLLEVATAGQRMVLVVDDLQWAAPATLLLLRHIIRCERPLALLLIVTFRSTELRPDEPLAELLADLQRDNSAQRITLGGLDEQAITVLLAAALGPGLADRAAQLTAGVHAQTAGNPFFVRELVAHLPESAALIDAGDGTATSAWPAKLEIPDELRSVVRHRVARLSQPARQLMTIASVAAGPVDVSLLQRMFSEHDGLLDAFDEATSAGLLVDCGRGRFAFAHALVRQAVYDDLSTARRLHLHRQLAGVLEAGSDGQRHVEALAYHVAQLAPDAEADKAAGRVVHLGGHRRSSPPTSSASRRSPNVPLKLTGQATGPQPVAARLA